MPAGTGAARVGQNPGPWSHHRPHPLLARTVRSWVPAGAGGHQMRRLAQVRAWSIIGRRSPWVGSTSTSRVAALWRSAHRRACGVSRSSIQTAGRSATNAATGGTFCAGANGAGGSRITGNGGSARIGASSRFASSAPRPPPDHRCRVDRPVPVLHARPDGAGGLGRLAWNSRWSSSGSAPAPGQSPGETAATWSRRGWQD